MKAEKVPQGMMKEKSTKAKIIPFAPLHNELASIRLNKQILG